MTATRHCLERHGRPICYYTDFRKVFSVNLNNPERIHKTQFERALQELNIGIIHAHSPQAKGRVERNNGIHQDRLVKMLRIENISTLDEANAYIQNVYMPKHNSKFAVPPKKDVNLHRSLRGYNLDNILCIKDQRVLMNDHTIRYRNRFFQLVPQQRTILFPRDTISVHEWLNGTIKLFIRQTELFFLELDRKPEKKKIEKQTRKAVVWKPPTDHPWRKYIR